MGNTLSEPDLFYPESDGLPMADSTVQLDWIILLITQLRSLVGEAGFVAGNLFWYPTRGEPRTVRAPDALVALGRPPGPRRSYKQWDENNVAPQVVFEVLSYTNTEAEMADALAFYDEHGVEEYYLIDPETQSVTAYRRLAGRLEELADPFAEASPLLGFRFALIDDELAVLHPNGRRFLAPNEREAELHGLYVESQDRAEEAEELLDIQRERTRVAEQRMQDAVARASRETKRAEKLQSLAEQEKARAELEKARAEIERTRAEALAAKLRALGIDPDVN
jgi:Uma2 family endonuclease